LKSNPWGWFSEELEEVWQRWRFIRQAAIVVPTLRMSCLENECRRIIQKATESLFLSLPKTSCKLICLTGFWEVFGVAKEIPYRFLKGPNLPGISFAYWTSESSTLQRRMRSGGGKSTDIDLWVFRKDSLSQALSSL
jgi:hypothetical protein